MPHQFNTCQPIHECNVRVRSTRSNAVDQLGLSTYRAIILVELLIHISNYNLSLVATLELTLHHPLPLPWQWYIHVSNQRKVERLPLQRPGVLAIVTYVSNERVPMRSSGSVEQPIKLLSGLT